MIEFVLIFALGFLAAAMIAMLITPAIYSRVVRLTERRIKATVPLSAAEIKGKSDLLRARHASDTAKLSAQLQDEQRELTSSRLTNNKLRNALSSLASEKSDADRRIGDLMTDSAELRSETRKQQQLIDKLSGDLSDFERLKKADTDEIIRLKNDLITISTEVESMKIDLAASDTELVSNRAEIEALQQEREGMQSDLASLTEAARALEQKYAQEQHHHNDTRIDLAASQSSLVNSELKVEALQTVRDELVAEKNREHDRHNETRIELAASQAALSDAQLQLGDARDRIEAMNTERQALHEEIGVINETARTLGHERDLEQERHANTRIELAAAQSSLADMEINLGHAQERVQELESVGREQQEEMLSLADAAKRLRAEFSREREQHETTRSRLALVETNLGQANEKVEALESVRAELQDEIGSLSATMQQLRHRYGLEQHRHENDRTELATSKASMSGIEADLNPSNQKVVALNSVRDELQTEIGALAEALERRRRDHVHEQEEHRKTRDQLAALRTELLGQAQRQNHTAEATEHQNMRLQDADRKNRESLKLAERRIITLTQKLDDARDSLEKSKSSVGELRATIATLKSEEEALRAEAARTAHHARELERRLTQAGFGNRGQDSELEEIRAALDARNHELRESRNAAAALELQLREKQQQVEDLDQKLKEAEKLLQERERELLVSSLKSGRVQSIRRGPNPVTSISRETPGSLNEQGKRLESQIDALKSALQKSKTMSGQFRQQLSKMRNEVNQLNHKRRPNGKTTAEDMRTATPEQPPNGSSTISDAMRSDAQLRDRVKELRERQRALLENLRAARDGTADQGLREEITDIAALVIGLSGSQDGEASPLLSMIGKPSASAQPSERRSLADRARSELER